MEEHGFIPSTQALLKERLVGGEPVDGLVVRALAQTAGAGQRGKAWSAGEGGSYQSVAFRDPSGALLRSFAALEVALGVAGELRDAGARVLVKWPNDVYLGGGKLAGVLCEHARGHLLVGVGVNVDNAVPDGAAALRGWRVGVVNELVLAGVLAGVAALLAAAKGARSAAGGGSLRDRYAAVDLLAGRRVSVLVPGRGGAPAELVEGAARGVDEAGALVVDCGAGERAIVTGSVRAWQ